MTTHRARYWEDLAAAMLETGQFHAARLSHGKLRRAHYAGRAIVRPATISGVPWKPIWAYAARLKAPEISGALWQELAWFYVRKDKASNGVLVEIVEELLASVPVNVNLFGITKRGAAMCVFEKHGLKPITKAVMPDVEEWADAVGLGDRRPETALQTKHPCPEAEQRWLFVRKV